MSSPTTQSREHLDLKPPVGAAQGMHAPIGEQDRVRTLDVLRGFALLGILLVNVQSFAMPTAAYLNPSAYGDLTGANLAAWSVTYVFFDQKFISIFSMLFGAGIVLFADRSLSAGRSAARMHYRRMFWLLLIGLVHAHFIWYGDILVVYSLCGMILYPLRRRSAKSLLVLGVLWIAIGSAIMFATGAALRAWPPDQLQSFTRDNWLPTPEMIAAELSAYQGGWLDQMPHRSAHALEFHTFIFLLVFFWRAGGLMLLGMALYKLGVLTGTARRGVYVALLGAAVLVGLPLVAWGAVRHFGAGWDVRYSFFLGSQFNNWASALVALGWVSAIVLLLRSGTLSGLMKRFEAVGRMALTHYIATSVICTLIFYGHGLGLFGQVERAWQVAIVVAIWTAQLLVAPVLVRRLRFGPLEWVWRSLTYGRRQQFLRTASG